MKTGRISMGFRKDFVWGAATSAYQIEGAVKEAGIAFYNDLIDELLKNNIEPYITMYHWDRHRRGS